MLQRVPLALSFDARLIAAAWQEWQFNAGRAGYFVVHFGAEPPAWFRCEELGYSPEHSPSLAWTVKNLPMLNRRAMRKLGAEAPLKVTYPPGLVRTGTPPSKLKTREPRTR